jgi:hypothetical protein
MATGAVDHQLVPSSDHSDYERYCDEHARGHAKARDIAYASALRKLQAMLDPEGPT